MIPLAAGLAVMTGALYLAPWPDGNPYLTLLWVRSPRLYQGLTAGYYFLWFASAWLCCVAGGQIVERLRTRGLKKAHIKAGEAPLLPPPPQREHLEVSLGVVYDPKRLGEPAANPRLAMIPEQGLYTGVLALASTGWGKTRWVLTPLADQLFGYKPHDQEQKIGGLALEVKGTFCDMVQDVLVRYGRDDDYIELRPGGKVKYNPIDPNMSPSAVATTINNLMINLYGESPEKFWSQVTGEAIKNITALFRRIQNGHCTLRDIMLALVDTEFLQEKVKSEVERSEAGAHTLIVTVEVYANCKEDLLRQGFMISDGELRAQFSNPLHEWLKAKKIPYQVEIDVSKKKDPQLASIARWFYGTWMKLRADLRSSVTSGITPFLGLFDTDPDLLETFCPPPDAEGLFEGWESVIESGKVVGCRFDTMTDDDMPRLLGTLIKQAYERAVLRRIPRMARERQRHWRQTVLIVDECHELLSVGATGFGDDKFLAKSREAKCIAVFATQSWSSLQSTMRTKHGADVVMGNLKTKIFGHTEDWHTAKYASDMCGQREQWARNVSMGESGQNSRISVLGPGAVSERSSLSANRGWSEQLRQIYRPDVFLNQLAKGQAIVRICDGDKTETMVVYMTPAAVPFEVN